MKQRKHRRIYEYILIIAIILGLDGLFLLRYNFSLTLLRWSLDLFTIAILVSFIAFIKNKKWRYIFELVTILIAFTFFITDSTLYFYKKDVTSIAMLIESFRDTMTIGLKYSPLEVFPIYGWFLIVIFVTIGAIMLKKIVFKANDINRRKQLRINTLNLLISFLGLAATTLFISDYEHTILDYPNDKVRFIENFGSITYHVQDISLYTSSLIIPDSLTEEYTEEIEEAELTIAETSPYFGMFEGKNVIFIMCETCEEYAYSREYTPNYFRLYDQSIYFSEFFSAAKSNYTYDAEFKSLTSMMYFLSDNYMYTYGENTFQNAIPYILKDNGYSTNSFHDFTKTFFNREQMHPQLGFENYYGREDMVFSETEFWPKDSEMFESMKDLMVPIQDNPFFTFIITVTSHGPYGEYRDELDEYYQILLNDPNYMEAEQEYLTLLAAQMDFDKGLGILLDDLEEKELMDDTLIVLYSDHKNYSSPEITDKYSTNAVDELDVNRVPMLIYGKGLTPEVSETLSSHYDITPTVLDLLGIAYYQDFYYGESLFLNERSELPIILSLSTWILDSYRLLYDEVVYGEVTQDEIEVTRSFVLAKIDFFEKLFITDYFLNNKTTIN